ncbi:MAG: YezD family protein [Deltaproteobacteria bacterium]
MTSRPSRFPGEPESPGAAAAPEVALEILGALQDIRFGSIEIVVHNGRVVQIERKEKFRVSGEERGRA